MKIIAAALLMLLGSAHAIPTLTEDERRQERLITDTIQGIIDSLAKAIRDRGLDPLTIEQWRGSFALSEPEVFSAAAYLTNFKFEGLSSIVIHRLNFSILQMRLQMAVSLPRVSVSIGSSGFELSALGRELSGSASGSLEVKELRVDVDARVSVGVISGINIRSLSITPSLGGIDVSTNSVPAFIQSQLNILFNDRDLSETVNDLLGNRLPNFLEENKGTIEELLVAIVIRLIEELL